MSNKHTFSSSAILRGVSLAVALTLSACTDKAAQPLPSPQATLQYAALGASDAVGLGASVPCGTATPTTPSCPGGTGYVPRIESLLTSGWGSPVALTDLGITSAVIGPDIKSLINQYGSTISDPCVARTGTDAVPADFITNEAPGVPTGSSYVTIFAGPNDVVGLTNALGCGAGGTTLSSQLAFVQAQALAFAQDYATLIASVRASSPNAHIVVANIPNIAGVPAGLSQTTTIRQALQAFSVAFDTVIDGLTTQNIPVVDLLCNSQSYAASNFSSDGFHPNDAGYSTIASLMEPLLLHPVVTQLSTSCSQAGLVTVASHAFGQFNMRNLNP